MARRFLIWSRGWANPLRFTLIELLMVVAVIAVLLTIMLPVLANIRKRGTKTKCAHNMRELGKAAINFTQDYIIYPQNIFTDLAAYGMQNVPAMCCPQTRWMTVAWGGYGTRKDGTGNYCINSYTIGTQPSTYTKPKIMYIESSKSGDGTCWWAKGGSSNTPNSYNQYIMGWTHMGASYMAVNVKRGNANYTFTDGTVRVVEWIPYSWNFNATGSTYCWGNEACSGMW
jgi:prepilin-type N-terminal cleavage/methylation domain-containing protein